MTDYRAVEPATKPPALCLSAQMVVFAEMAAPEIRGAAHMVGTDWQAEALRLEGAVDLLRDVAGSGVAFEDPRLSYVEVQIDRATWDAIAAYGEPS